MTDPFADAADYFGDDAAPTPPLSPRPALFPAPSAEEVAEAKARKEAAAACASPRRPDAPRRELYSGPAAPASWPVESRAPVASNAPPGDSRGSAPNPGGDSPRPELSPSVQQ